MSGPDPLRLQFDELSRHRPRALVSPFGRVERPGPSTLAAGERLDLGAAPPAPFWAVTADLARRDAAASPALGVSGPAGEVLLRAVPGEQRWVVEVGRAGERAVVCSAPAPPVPGRVALVANENQVTVLTAPAGTTDDGAWRPLATARDDVRRALDLRSPEVLEGLRFVARAEGSGVTELAGLRAGSFGAAGVRDPQVVTRPDGRPLVRDGRLILTMTCAGLGFFQQAHWGVWALDLADPGRLEQVGELYFRRDGLVLGDHAGHVDVDEEAGETLVLVSSWGDHDPERGGHIRQVRTSADVLSGTHVLETERVAVPSEASVWDPSLAHVDGRWHLAFTECTSFGPPRYVFRPALAVTDHADATTGLRRVGADLGLEQTEGTILQRFGGRWYLLASDGDAREHPVYDTAMRRLGTLQAPYGTNIPHPMAVRAGDGGAAPWWLVTFDGTPWGDEVLGYGTHGDFLVLHAPPPARPSVRARADAVRRRLAEAVRRG